MTIRRAAWIGRFAGVAIAALSIACSPGRPASVAAPRPAVHVRVLATHDVHGALRPVVYPWSDGRPVGGLAFLKTMMDRLEAECACPTLRLDGGDEMQGTLESNLSAGAAAVAAFNALPLDAAAVGNHELDWGVDTLRARQREAHYPWLAANVFRVDDGKRPDWARPYAVVERGGVKVGIVGYATVLTPQTLRPDVTRPYTFKRGYQPIRDALDAVWQQHPDFVAIVAHAGGSCSAERCAGEMIDLASELPAGIVHLIVGGHEHLAGDGVANGIPIIRAGSDGRGLGVIDLYRRGDGIHAFRISQQTTYDDGVAEDRAMAELLAPYLRAADARRAEQVTVLTQPLSRLASGDRRLGSLLADAARQAGHTDIGLMNPGGVRADLVAGPVSYADLYRVMPFGNALVRLTLTGRQLRQLVEKTGPRYYFSKLPSPIADDRSYTLATVDFLADGGDGLDMLAPLPREALGVSQLDAVVEYLRALPRPLTPPLPAEVSTAPQR